MVLMAHLPFPMQCTRYSGEGIGAPGLAAQADHRCDGVDRRHPEHPDDQSLDLRVAVVPQVLDDGVDREDDRADREPGRNLTRGLRVAGAGKRLSLSQPAHWSAQDPLPP